LALDTENEHIYWTEANPFAPRRIRRANMDGRNLVDLIINLERPTSIELDVAAGKMYYVDAGVIYRSDLNGSVIEPLVDDLGAYDIALDLTNKMMYVLGNGVWRMGLDGSSPEFLGDVTPQNLPGFAVEVDLPGEKLYLLDSLSATNGVIRRAALDGSHWEIVTETGYSGIAGLAYDTLADQVYWGQGNIFQGFRLYRACEDGVNFESIAFNAIGTICGIAIDHRNADATGDGCAMDLRDWASFQQCFRPSPDLPGRPTSQLPCLSFDFDADRQTIGWNDFYSFLAYFAGPQ
jgi:hypothetical protein